MDKHKLWDDDTAEFHFCPMEDGVITKKWSDIKGTAYVAIVYENKCISNMYIS